MKNNPIYVRGLRAFERLLDMNKNTVMFLAIESTHLGLIIHDLKLSESDCIVLDMLIRDEIEAIAEKKDLSNSEGTEIIKFLNNILKKLKRS